MTQTKGHHMNQLQTFQCDLGILPLTTEPNGATSAPSSAGRKSCCHGVDIPNDPATFEVYAMISAKCSRSLQLRCDTNQDAEKDCPKLLIFYPCNFYTAFPSAKILKYHQPCPPYVDTIPVLTLLTSGLWRNSSFWITCFVLGCCSAAYCAISWFHLPNAELVKMLHNVTYISDPISGFAGNNRQPKIQRS